MGARSIETTGRATVTMSNGQRAHRDHAEQEAVVAGRFESPRQGVWTAIGNGISNQSFIQAPEGVIAIDTGESVEEMRDSLAQLRAINDSPIVGVIYTHFHYVEGTRAILDEGNHVSPLPVIGHERIAVNKSRASAEIGPAYSRGIVEQFQIALPEDGPDGRTNVGIGRWFRNPDHAPFTPGYVPVNRELSGQGGRFELGGLGIEWAHAPSDADDSVNFWIPSLGTCVNNSVWPALFNVFAIRGEEYRDPRVLLRGIDQILSWSPEFLVGAHGPAIVGQQKVREIVTRYRDSIQFLWDQTVRCINKGMTSDEIAHAVVLPEVYGQDHWTSELYGVTEHHVRQIHSGLRGWFDGEESRLFPLEPIERHRRLIEGFGGRGKVQAAAERALEDGDVRWATELATWLTRSDGVTQGDRELLANCLRTIAERTPSANIRSWSLTRARDLDGSGPMDRFRRHRFNPRLLGHVDTPSLIATLRVLLEPSKVVGVDHHVAFIVDGVECGLHVRNGVAVPTNGWGAGSVVRASRESLVNVLAGIDTWSKALNDGRIEVSGDHEAVDRVRSAFEIEGLAS